MKKTFKLLGLSLLLGGAVLLSSCEKDDIRKSKPVNPSTVDNTETVEDTTQSENDVEGAPAALFVNLLDQGVFGDVSIRLNDIPLVEDLGIKEITDYLSLDLSGELTTGTLEVLSNGQVIAVKELDLVGLGVANIVLTEGLNGEGPIINVLDLNLLDFQDGNALGLLEGLGLGQGTELFDLNFLNLTDLTDVESLLAGVDLLNADGDLVGGLLELPQGVLSGVLSGNDDILSNLDLLGSDLALEDLLSELLGQNGLLEVLELGDLVGLGNISNGGLLEGVLGLVEDLLAGILGGGESPLSLLDGQLLEGLNLQPGNDYTAILTGGENGLPIDLTIIDQTAAGLNDLLSGLNQQP